jgi:hypothetical protein
MAHFLLFSITKIKNKRGGHKMAEKKGNQKEFSTCLEDTPLAEIMQKMLGQQGIGSLCTKMMKQVLEKPGAGSSFPCAEMMRSMLKGCCGNKEASNEINKEEDHG